MPELFGTKAQTITEQETEVRTREYRKTINEELPIMIDILFKLTYFVEPLDTESINFKSYCYDHYEQIPYTFSCLYNIFVKGYYNEVMVLVRHLYEVLAKLRYFKIHENLLKAYLQGAKKFNFEDGKVERVTEKLFFSLDSDDTFYKKDYSYLSRLAHGKDLFTVFRTEKPEYKKFMLGNHFDAEFVDYFLMQIIALLYGYLNCYVLFFPQNEMSRDRKFQHLYTKTIEGMEDIIKWHKQNNPESREWYLSIEKYIDR